MQYKQDVGSGGARFMDDVDLSARIMMAFQQAAAIIRESRASRNSRGSSAAEQQGRGRDSSGSPAGTQTRHTAELSGDALSSITVAAAPAGNSRQNVLWAEERECPPPPGRKASGHVRV